MSAVIVFMVIELTLIVVGLALLADRDQGAGYE